MSVINYRDKLLLNQILQIAPILCPDFKQESSTSPLTDTELAREAISSGTLTAIPQESILNHTYVYRESKKYNLNANIYK